MTKVIDIKSRKKLKEYRKAIDDLYSFIEKFEMVSDRQLSQTFVELGNNTRKASLSISQILHYLESN